VFDHQQLAYFAILSSSKSIFNFNERIVISGGMSNGDAVAVSNVNGVIGKCLCLNLVRSSTRAGTSRPIRGRNALHRMTIRFNRLISFKVKLILLNVSM
jgi:hypothetical protein